MCFHLSHVFCGNPTVTTLGWLRRQSWGDITVLFHIVVQHDNFLKTQCVSSAFLTVITCVERSQAICRLHLLPRDVCVRACMCASACMCISRHPTEQDLYAVLIKSGE